MVQLNSPSVDTPQGCVHHWLCGDQRDKVVHATCAKCGMETDFVQGVFPERLDLKALKNSTPLSLLFDRLHGRRREPDA
jgi:hypothetical protein